MKTEIRSGYGPMTLFGSGGTLSASRKAYDLTAELLGNTAHIAVVETPADLQTNSRKWPLKLTSLEYFCIIDTGSFWSSRFL